MDAPQKERIRAYGRRAQNDAADELQRAERAAQVASKPSNRHQQQPNASPFDDATKRRKQEKKGAHSFDVRSNKSAPRSRRIDALQRNLRSACKRQRTLSFGSTASVLLKELEEANNGKYAEQIDAELLLTASAACGVSMNAAEARALVKRVAAPNDDASEFAQRIMNAHFQNSSKPAAPSSDRTTADTLSLRSDESAASQSHLTASSAHVCRGIPEDVDDLRGAIIHPKCRRTLRISAAPGLHLHDAIQRSSEKPSCFLDLQFVYGFGAHACVAPSVFCTNTGEVVYNVGALGVVYDVEMHSQRFFRQHTDDITSLTLCRSRCFLQQNNYPARAIVASGQRKRTYDPDSGKVENPFVSIWDSRHPGGGELHRIQHPPEARQIAALAFSPDGERIATVSCDNAHTVRVWLLKSKKIGWDHIKADDTFHGLEWSARGYNSKPTSVFGIAWHPAYPKFLTFGVKHIKLWYGRAGTSQQLRFGKHGSSDVCSACFIPSIGKNPGSADEEAARILAGLSDGAIMMWDGETAIAKVQAHHAGPKRNMDDGCVRSGGICAMHFDAEKRILRTGGSDGTVRQWALNANRHEEVIEELAEPIELSTPASDSACKVRALDASPASDGKLFVGTDMCDIVEIDTENAISENVLNGSAGHVYTVAPHPTRAELVASTSTTGRVFVWDARHFCAKKVALIDHKALCAAFSNTCISPAAPRGATLSGNEEQHHLAIGCSKGTLIIVEESTMLKVHKNKLAQQSISDIKYSPNDKHLAVASHDCVIDILSVQYRWCEGKAVEVRYRRTRRCSGHSSTVTHIDFGCDSLSLISCSADYELLCWSILTGKQLYAEDEPDETATQTCVLGINVMGIWPKFSDGTDVNSLDRTTINASTERRQVIATADDYGFVKLFHYPCLLRNAPFNRSSGHSSHVSCVRFSNDGRLAFSAGSKDRAIFQYELKNCDG